MEGKYGACERKTMEKGKRVYPVLAGSLYRKGRREHGGMQIKGTQLRWNVRN